MRIYVSVGDIWIDWCKRNVTPLLTHWRAFCINPSIYRVTHNSKHIANIPASYVFIPATNGSYMILMCLYCSWNYVVGVLCVQDRKFQDFMNRYLLIHFNTLVTETNCHHFADDIFKCIFLNKNIWISLKISLKFVPKVRINNIPSLVQIMAWSQPGDKTLFEPMMDSLLTHICVTRRQWI